MPGYHHKSEKSHLFGIFKHVFDRSKLVTISSENLVLSRQQITYMQIELAFFLGSFRKGMDVVIEAMKVELPQLHF